MMEQKEQYTKVMGPKVEELAIQKNLNGAVITHLHIQKKECKTYVMIMVHVPHY